MIYARNKDGNRILATKIEDGWCFGCDGLMRAKMGNVMVHHWSHVTKVHCDEWNENEGEWHLHWKDWFQKISEDITLEKCIKIDKIWHFADVYSEKRKIVVELQHSPISITDIRKREDFYGNMIWLFDCQEVYKNNRFNLFDKGSYYSYSWKHCRKSILECNKPVYLHLDHNLVFELKSRNINGRMYGWGKKWFYDEFMLKVL